MALDFRDTATHPSDSEPKVPMSAEVLAEFDRRVEDQTDRFLSSAMTFSLLAIVFCLLIALAL
jgi:hypothetical protein